MIAAIICVAALVIALGLWSILAVGTKGNEKGDEIFEKWYEEKQKARDHSDRI